MKPHSAPSYRSTALLVCLALVLLSPAAGSVAESEEATILEGEYVWQRSDKDIKGPLKAVFEPQGENTWSVSFHFTFQSEEHTYKGTATGALGKGELKGEVMSDGDEPRPFNFEGAFEDGTFRGEHGAMRNGENRQTGTMILRP
ncbi:MAG: hypothetical protein AAF725_24060 [Acidobacteriota bacterium]